MDEEARNNVYKVDLEYVSQTFVSSANGNAPVTNLNLFPDALLTFNMCPFCSKYASYITLAKLGWEKGG